MIRWRVLLPCLATAAGCAYYNGLFNANRLANEARRAEREGRTSEARSLWSQSAVRAESVASRFPRSKYRDDALVLQGTALSRIGACSQSVKPLQLAADSSPDPALRNTARLVMGRCWLSLDLPDSAVRALSGIAGDAESATRGQVLLLLGQARLRLGNDSAALRDLTASGVREAVFPAATARARMGDIQGAVEMLRSEVGRPYLEPEWLAALDSVGARDQAAVTEVVSALAARDELTVGQRARLLLGDGARWLRAGDTSRAVPRLLSVADAAPDSAEGRVARVHLAIRAVRAAERASQVPALLDSLQAPTRLGGPALQAAGPFLGVMTRAHESLRETGSALWLFLAAEEVRDSLATPVLAAALFAEVHRQYPESIITPKALLAEALLRPADADSLVSLVRRAYPQSVYTLALGGLADDRFRAVEDSLRRVARSSADRRSSPAGDGRRVRNDR